ncbi:MAG: hypothetical protein FJY17_10665 [Bacteroidetes bacterium]|nr:hypothetical protein [Bacteroidota bacterium]
MNEQKIPSVGDWVITLLLVSIPLVNFVVLIYWAVSSSTDTIKSNFAKAALIWIAAIIALYALFFGAMIGALLS